MFPGPQTEEIRTYPILSLPTFHLRVGKVYRWRYNVVTWSVSEPESFNSRECRLGVYLSPSLPPNTWHPPHGCCPPLWRPKFGFVSWVSPKKEVHRARVSVIVDADGKTGSSCEPKNIGRKVLDFCQEIFLRFTILFCISLTLNGI